MAFSYIRRMCRQTATYWAPSATPFNTYGDPAYSAPLILDPASGNGVRLEDKTIEMITTKTGDQQQSKAIVWSPVTQFAIGGYLLLGFSSASNPTAVKGANIILAVSADLSTDGKSFLFKALM